MPWATRAMCSRWVASDHVGSGFRPWRSAASARASGVDAPSRRSSLRLPKTTRCRRARLTATLMRFRSPSSQATVPGLASTDRTVENKMVSHSPPWKVCAVPTRTSLKAAPARSESSWRMSLACARKGVTTPRLSGGMPHSVIHAVTASASARFSAPPERPRSVRPSTSCHWRPRGRSSLASTRVSTVSRLP